MSQLIHSRKPSHPWTRWSYGLGCGLVILFAGVSGVWAQRLTVQASSNEIYAGTPFELQFVAEGFEESPTPTLTPPTINGAKVKSMGVTPQVSSFMSSINGRTMKQEKRVSFVFQFQVTPDRAGRYNVPAVTATQGSKSAQSQPATFEAETVSTTNDMKLALVLPNRPVTVGETFDVHLDWYLRSDPDDPTFSVPFLEDSENHFDFVFDNAGNRRRGLPFTVHGQQQAMVPEQSQATYQGGEYTRVRFSWRATALTPGSLTIPASTVSARLQVGEGRDSFGFPVGRYSTFVAQDSAHTLEVKDIPAQGRPASYAGAIGAGFSIDVAAGQTVVRVGDPIELTITIRGAGSLAGVSLPPLSGPTGLPPAEFGLPSDPVSGVLSEDGKSKQFKVSARLLKKEVSQIPPIEFGYYDPAKGSYGTARSQAIALSVAGSSLISTDSVVSNVKKDQTNQKVTQDGGGMVGNTSGADLALSSAASTLSQVATVQSLRVWLVLLYGVPTLVLLALWGFRRSQKVNPQKDSAKALAAVVTTAADVQSMPAKDAVPKLRQVLRNAKNHVADRKTYDGVLAELDAVSFDPARQNAPLSAELLHRVKALGQASKRGSSAGAALGMIFLVGLFAPSTANAAPADNAVPAGNAAPADNAAPPGQVSVQSARQLYEQALSQEDRPQRRETFSAAAEQYRQLAQTHARSPELLTDWGNAALGAFDLGYATLAYRRALVLKPNEERAARNLSWIRQRQPAWAVQSSSDSATDTFFFWHKKLTLGQKHFFAAVSYALFILLILPVGRSKSLRRKLSLFPLVVCLALLISAFGPNNEASQAVVIPDGLVLRSADSLGAPPAQAEPIPHGAEVTVQERRGEWCKVALANGVTGWLSNSAVQTVNTAE